MIYIYNSSYIISKF